MASRLATIFALVACTGVMFACDVDDDDGLLNCTAAECVPTYRLHLESPEAELATGLWRVDLEIDGAMISAECMVSGPNEGPESIPCEVADWTSEPDRPLDVSVSVNTRVSSGSGEATDSGTPPETSNQGIFVTVVAEDEQAPVTTLDVAVQLDEAAVFETQRTPTYEVEEDFNGPGCGSCIRGVEDVAMLP